MPPSSKSKATFKAKPLALLLILGIAVGLVLATSASAFACASIIPLVSVITELLPSSKGLVGGGVIPCSSANFS